MPNSLEALTKSLLKAAADAGADAADAVAVNGTSVSIDVRGGALENAERSEGTEIGLRVMIGKRQSCVSASDTSAMTISQMAERAVAMAAEAPEDPYVGLADPDALATALDAAALDLADPSPEPSADMLQEDARQAEAAALAVSGVTQVQSASGGYGSTQVYRAASNGFAAGYARTSRGISAVAITGEGTGMERDYCGESRIYGSDLPSAEEIGTLAGERTVARAGAQKPPTGAFPVLYDERISASLVGHLLAAIGGSSITRGASWLRDAMGEMVLPPALSLIDEPHLKRIGASRLFDAEGLPTKRLALVQDGVLSSWILDLSTARNLGLESTGHATRGLSSPPSPSPSNVLLTQGDKSREQLIAEMGTGLLVTSMIGSSVNPTTGDYSRGASGFWVENGEVTYPVNECTIAGNLRTMLQSIIPANDARAHVPRQVPSLLVEGLTIAGN